MSNLLSLLIGGGSVAGGTAGLASAAGSEVALRQAMVTDVATWRAADRPANTLGILYSRFFGVEHIGVDLAANSSADVDVPLERPIGLGSGLPLFASLRPRSGGCHPSGSYLAARALTQHGYASARLSLPSQRVLRVSPGPDRLPALADAWGTRVRVQVLTYFGPSDGPYAIEAGVAAVSLGVGVESAVIPLPRTLSAIERKKTSVHNLGWRTGQATRQGGAIAIVSADGSQIKVFSGAVAGTTSIDLALGWITWIGENWLLRSAYIGNLPGSVDAADMVIMSEAPIDYDNTTGIFTPAPGAVPASVGRWARTSIFERQWRSPPEAALGATAVATNSFPMWFRGTAADANDGSHVNIVLSTAHSVNGLAGLAYIIEDGTNDPRSMYVYRFDVNVRAPDVYHLNGAVVSSAGSGNVAGDVLTLAGGTYITPAKVRLAQTATGATIVSGGGGYGASQTFDLTVVGGELVAHSAYGAAKVNVTTNAAGAVTTVNSITAPGGYLAVPGAGASTTAPTSGAGSGGSGCTLTLTLGLLPVVDDPGNYTVQPASPVSVSATTGVGSGMQFTANWIGGARTQIVPIGDARLPNTDALVISSGITETGALGSPVTYSTHLANAYLKSVDEVEIELSAGSTLTRVAGEIVKMPTVL